MILSYWNAITSPFLCHYFSFGAIGVWGERCFKLTFSKSVLLSFETKLMALLNMPQEMSKKTATLRLKMKQVYNKQIINTVT